MTAVDTHLAKQPGGITAGNGWSARMHHLSRPGPQPHNQIGTLREMLALARTPRSTPGQASRAVFEEQVEGIVRRVLVEELPVAVEYIMSRRRA